MRRHKLSIKWNGIKGCPFHNANNNNTTYLQTATRRSSSKELERERALEATTGSVEEGVMSTI